MSETTTAFLAGTAVAGVSALLLIKGGFSLGQPVTQMPVGMTPAQSSAVLSQVPAPAPITTTLPALSPELLAQAGGEQLRSQFAAQQQVIDQLKTQLEQQRVLATQLQTQLETQRTESQRVAAQIQDQKRDQDIRDLLKANGVVAPTVQAQNQQNTQVIMLWAVGGVFLLLIVGGGVMLLTVVLMSQQSSSRRGNGKTNYIVQPLPMPAPSYNPQPYPPRQAGPMYALPPRIRQVDAKAYYDDDDF